MTLVIAVHKMPRDDVVRWIGFTNGSSSTAMAAVYEQPMLNHQGRGTFQEKKIDHYRRGRLRTGDKTSPVQ